MKITYKVAEPEIIIMPTAMGVLEYISKNIKTNLVWLGVVRKIGNKYIFEDVYIPPQNVNEYVMCNYDEQQISLIMEHSTYMYDARPCRFNLIGRFTMGKSVSIDIKDFNKIIPKDTESVLMQLNNQGLLEFAINKRTLLIEEVPFRLDCSKFIDIATLETALESKIGAYKFADKSTNTNVIKKPATEAKVEPKSKLILDNMPWYSVL